MEKDIAEKRLEEYNDVFADIYNVAVFGGRQAVFWIRLDRSQEGT